MILPHEGPSQLGEHLRIALLTYEFPPETRRGGIGTYAENLALALQALGDEVHVYAGTLRNFCWKEVVDSLEVRRTSLEGMERALAQVVRKTMLFETMAQLENGIAMTRAVHREHRLNRYDIVESPDYGGEGLFLNLRSDVKKVVRLHSALFYVGEAPKKLKFDMRIARWMQRRSLVHADLITSPTRFLADLVKADLGEGREIFVVPYGINIARFDARFDPGFDIHQHLGIDRDTKVVFFAGRLEPRKGIDTLAQAIPRVIERYPRVLFAIAGLDYHPSVNSALIRRELFKRGWEDKARFLGFVDDAILVNLLMRADVFVLPSNFENFPYSLIEAMVAGSPIVSTRVGGIPEIIEDGKTGILVEKGDEEALAKGILQFLEDKDLASEFGRRARKSAEERFDHVAIGRTTKELYRSAVS